MSVKRPYKVTYHYEAGPNRAQAITGTDSSHELCKVRKTAQEVSRRGGAAEVWTCDPMTGERYTLRTYQPFETAIEGLLSEFVDDLIYREA